ncbi:hypothetical protein ACWDRB_46595 [Nonomuraea sp. NPDC003707]
MANKQPPDDPWDPLARERQAIRAAESKEALSVLMIVFACLGLLAGGGALTEEGSTPASWIVIAASAALGTFGAAWMWRLSKAEKQRQLQLAARRAHPLKPRVEAVTAAFAEASQLMAELQHDLELQQAAHQILAEAVDEHQNFLDVNHEQAQKIREIVLSDIHANRRGDRRQQWLFFILGVAVSIPIGVVINVLVP